MNNMRKLFLILFLFISIAGFSQPPAGMQKPTTRGYQLRNVIVDSFFSLPADTFSVPTDIRNYPHAARKGTTIYVWNTSTFVWQSVGGASFTGSQGDLLYFSATNTIANLSKSTLNNSFLRNSASSNNPQWSLFRYDSLSNTPTLPDFKSDTTRVSQFNTAALSNAQSPHIWHRGSTYSANTTETVVSTGLQVVNSYSGGLTPNMIVYDSSAEMASSDATIMMELKVTSFNSGAYIGLNFLGAATFTGFGTYSTHLFIQLTSKDVSFITQSGAHSAGTMVNAISAGDSVRIYYNRKFALHTARIFNITKNTNETFSWAETGTGYSVSSLAGYYLQNGTFIIKKLSIYSNKRRPDLLILGSSISNGMVATKVISETFWGRLQDITNLDIACLAMPFTDVGDMHNSLAEILAIKPSAVLIEGPYNNAATMGQAVSVWSPVFRNLVDSLLSYGIRVIVQKIVPASNGSPAVINTWIDTTYTNHPKVQILNLYNTTPLYDADSANVQDRTYYVDGIHPNVAGMNEMAQYVKTQIERMLRFNMNGATDATLSTRREFQVWYYDSTGINQGEWKTAKLTGATLSGDEISVDVRLTNTATLTNKRITQRVTTTASSSTPTPDGDASDMFTVTALAAGATFGAPTGTPTDGQTLLIRIKDNGTARTLAWNAIYRESTDFALPTTTVISKTMYVYFVYNTADSKWDCVGLTEGF